MGITCLQSRNHTFPNLTVREMLQLSQVVHVPENVVGLLDKRAADLSGGEKQKVATACALKGRPFSIGLLDEPFAALDKDAINFLLQELSTLPDKAFLIVEPAFIPHLK